MEISAYYKTAVCAVFAAALIPMGAYAYSDGDFQVWNTDVEEMKVAKDLKAEVYYILQSNKVAGTWTDANVLGTKFKVAF